MGTARGTVLSLICLNPNKFGSYEEFELQLAGRLQAADLKQVKAFVADPPDSIREQFVQRGAEISSLSRSCGPVAYYSSAAALFRRHRPDVLHLSFFPVLTPLIRIARFCGVRKIALTDHSSGRPRPKSPWKERLFLAANHFNAAAVDKVIAVSNFVRKRLIGSSGFPSEKVRVIYNGINPERFAPLCESEAAQSNATDFDFNASKPVFTDIQDLADLPLPSNVVAQA